MKKLAMIAAAAAFLAVGSSAQAQIVLGTQYTAYLTQLSSAQPDLQIKYTVTADGSDYLYTYIFTVGTLSGSTFTPTTSSSLDKGNPVVSLTVDASYVISASAGGNIYDGDVVWNYGTPKLSGTVSLVSAFLPTLGDATGNDGAPDVAWASGDEVAVPVPEASTVMAGALMLLPLGIGAIRAVRKERIA